MARRKKTAAPAPARSAARSASPAASPVTGPGLGPTTATTRPAPFPYRRLLVNLLIAFVPVVVVWLLLTPFYNRFLLGAGENLVHLVESPDVTELLPAARDPHYGLVTRLDFPPSRRLTQTFRVTDLHFHLVLLGALFLAMPGVPLRKRLADLGVAALASVFFHLVLVLFWVQFVYATQLGAWSMEHYGAFARNFWGLGKHLLDLPFKLALPFVLWAAFYLDRLLPRRRTEPGGP